jgi:hypothetical protein
MPLMLSRVLAARRHKGQRRRQKTLEVWPRSWNWFGKWESVYRSTELKDWREFSIGISNRILFPWPWKKQWTVVGLSATTPFAKPHRSLWYAYNTSSNEQISYSEAPTPLLIAFMWIIFLLFLTVDFPRTSWYILEKTSLAERCETSSKSILYQA